MSGKTKIVVLRMRQVVTALLFVGIGILLAIILITNFANERQDKEILLENPEDTEGANDSTTLEGALYIPGTYSTQIVLGKENVLLSVTVDQNTIQKVELTEKTEAVDTLYPLLEPTLAQINEKLSETGTLDESLEQTENRYTSMVLLQAIRSSLGQAKAE